MSLKLYKKSAWGNTNVQLPEEEMLLDMDNPIHAAIKGSLVREAQRAEGPEDIVNVMKLAGVSTIVFLLSFLSFFWYRERVVK